MHVSFILSCRMRTLVGRILCTLHSGATLSVFVKGSCIKTTVTMRQHHQQKGFLFFDFFSGSCKHIQRKGVNWLFGDSAAQLKYSGVVIVLNYHHIQIEIRTNKIQNSKTLAHTDNLWRKFNWWCLAATLRTLHKQFSCSPPQFFCSVSFILSDTTIHASTLRASSDIQSKMKEFAFKKTQTQIQYDTKLLKDRKRWNEKNNSWYRFCLNRILNQKDK